MHAEDYLILALVIAAVLCALMFWYSLLKPAEEAAEVIENGHIIAEFLRDLADWDRNGS